MMNGKARILLVDDSPEDRHAYQAYLNQVAGGEYAFSEAEDVQEAIEQCRSSHVDCVLLDYELPDTDGIEFMDRLAEFESSARIPVVMITGRGNERIAVAAIKRGAVDYLLKAELTPEALYRAVQNAVTLRETKDALHDAQSQRHVAEESLHDTEQRFRLLIDCVRDYAILMLDREGRIASWNLGARRMFGYEEAQIVGQPFAVLFTEEDREQKVPERELELARSRAAAPEERWHVRRGGEPFWASGVLSAIFDAHQSLIGYAKVIHDMTSHKASERRLQDAVFARDEFISIASHELKTPLSACVLEIQGLVRMLKKNENAEAALARAKTCVQRIDTQFLRLIRLVEDLLDTSRINANRLELSFEECNLADVLETVVNHLRPMLEAANVEVRRELEGGVTGFWDRVRLEQVFANLLSNVAKYAPGHPVVIKVWSEFGMARASVRDFGPGIAPENQERIFMRFERAMCSSRVSGLGLGLFIVREILTALEGKIWVTSAAQGAEFHIALPMRPSKAFTNGNERSNTIQINA